MIKTMQRYNMDSYESESENTIVHRVPTSYFNGLPVSKRGFNEKHYHDILKMVPKDGDIFINSFPKCGTTWYQFIVWGILNDGAIPPNTNQMKFKEVPFLQYSGLDNIDDMPSPRAFTLHLPMRMASISEKAKYIFILRNPFDCCVSFFHHLNEIDLKIHKQVLDFDSYFEDFLKGEIPYGSYLDFINAWYTKKNEPNFLFLSFEDTKENPEKTLLRVAEFIGPSYKKKLIDNPEIKAKILEHTSFDYMKKHCAFRSPKTLEVYETMKKNYISTCTDPIKTQDDDLFKTLNFYRKGTVGSSKTVLTEEQWFQIDQAIDDKIQDPELRKILRKTEMTKNKQ